ncbi:MAG: hypothetical protein HGA65_01335, partial [Oscillochloris sp.]|nr:hypothetical protein [Oscillochloris sp.]
MLNQRPLSYRAEIIAPLIQSLAAGESCSVVGINGVGKTNMLQQLRRPDVVEHFAAGRGELLAFCSLDANLLTQHDGWGFFEGMAEALLADLQHMLPTGALSRLTEEHAAILASPGNYPLALRHCAGALDAVLSHRRLVIIFDEFDALLPQLPDITLRNLRGLRDRHKYQLMYLTLSRERLPTLCDEDCQEAGEPFLELLSLCELGLHPLGEEDARREAARFAERYQRTLNPSNYERIITLSGGHPGLLRALTQVAIQQDILPSEPRDMITNVAALRNECLKLWNDLSGDERDALWQAHRSSRLDPRRGEDLLLKGLLRKGKAGQLTIFSPLLAALVDGEIARTATTAPADSRPVPIAINHASQHVCYYGREIGDSLSQLNFRLLSYLYGRYGELCSESEVTCAVHPDEKADGNSERISVMVRRLSRKLKELAPNEPEI